MTHTVEATTAAAQNDIAASIEQRTSEFFHQQYDRVLRRTDRLFAGLILLEWLAAIVASIVISPQTWAGLSSTTHVHVWTALFLGGAIASFPIYLALHLPGRTLTRHVIAVGQMSMSALLIHLTGGRIETHFHIFGSLAFLAFYRDWRVLLTATVVVTLDHAVRGALWPESVFGVLVASPWRTLEHAAWVVFEVVFLSFSCVQGIREMQLVAGQQAHLAITNDRVEAEVRRQTCELRRAEGRLRLIVEAAPCGMLTIRDDGRVTMVNVRMEEMFGYMRDQMIGHPIEMLIPGGLRELEHRHRDSSDEDRQPTAMGGDGEELLGRRKDGHEIYVEIGLTHLGSSEGEFLLATVVEVTERRMAERELKRYAEMADATNASLQRYADEADAANRAKSEFLANMSHELRTPLNAIIGFSEGLLERVDRHPLNDHQIDRLSKIKKSGDHLLALINNVLDLAKVESGRVEVHATCFQIEPLADELSALAEGLLRGSPEVQFQLDLGDRAEHLHSDRDKVKQILINLLGNAAKFTRQGHIALRFELDDQYYRVSVEDTGIGIPDDQLPKVFEKFHQVEQAQHQSIKGTGLGLALCRSFAGLLGGTLTVRSSEGAGSTFTLCLPLVYDAGAQGEQQELVEQIKNRCQGAGVSDEQLLVLCIEDDPPSMEVLLDCLEDRGLRVIPAFDGHEGLKIAREQQPDAITLDVMMPGLDGWEVLRRLKADEATRNIPVILTTAIDDTRLALSLGAESYLVKPIDRESLCNTVANLATQRGTALTKLAVVDDDPVVREILREVLEEEGYAVRCCESGKGFLTELRSEPPDAIVLDLMMPDVDGFGVLDHLRSEPQTAGIPVIVMTAKTLSGTDLARLHGRIRAVVEKNGLSRDKALDQLIGHLREMKQEMVMS